MFSVANTGFMGLALNDMAVTRAKWEFAQNEERYRSERPEYVRADGDMPWIGMLGEMVFAAFLNWAKVDDWRRADGDARTSPDFWVNGWAIDCKTSKCSRPLKTTDLRGFTNRQLARPKDQYFFLTYEHKANRMWLLGGIGRETFKRKATFWRAGTSPHDGWLIRPGQECNLLPVGDLVRPLDWLRELEAHPNKELA